MGSGLEEIIEKMSEKEKIELASEIMKRINEETGLVSFETDPFFAEGLTDESTW